MAGISAFREAFVSADMPEGLDFSSFDARQFRYALYWAMYENTAYRNVHSWAVSYRQGQALYKYIRGIYNPSYRLGEFWKAHLWGGRLDPEAGDGTTAPSCLPIITDNEKVRKPISTTWKDSNWQIQKDINTLYGAVMGDVPLMVVDDTEREKVYLQVLHPSLITDVELDAWGNVKAYVLEETRPDPNQNLSIVSVQEEKTVSYKEVAERDGDNVVYSTYLNGTLYPWYGEEATWEVPYGFIPLIMVQHNNVGLEWGWSELHPDRGKFQEVDDISSKLSDQIRKMVDAPWLFSGMDKPKATPKASSATTPSASDPQPGREEVKAFYAPMGASATPLVANLDIGATATHINSMLAELERDYPELQMDIWSVRENSGRALRIARQRVETKVNQRRAIYDEKLVRALQMAISIGGYRNYPGYEGFSLDSYDKGNEDFTIGERPVFSKDPLDDLEIEIAFWKSAEQAVKVGIPIEFYLKNRQNWTEDQIKELTESPEFQAKAAQLAQAKMMAEAMSTPEGEGGGEGGGEEEAAPTGNEEGSI